MVKIADVILMGRSGSEWSDDKVYITFHETVCCPLTPHEIAEIGNPKNDER